MAIWEGRSSPVSPDMVSAVTPPDAGEQSAGYWDYIKSGAQTADDFVRAAANAVTFGMADRLSGALPGGAGSTDAEVARSEAARQRSPVVSLAGDVAGSMAIPGLGGEALAARLGGRLGGRALGYGLEGAAVGAGQGAGNTYTGNLPDYVQNALIGGGIGGVTGGVMGSIFGGRPLVSRAKTPTQGEMSADTAARYNTLRANPTQYDASHLAQRSDDLTNHLFNVEMYDPEITGRTNRVLDRMREPYETAVADSPSTVGTISPAGIDLLRKGINRIPTGETHTTDRATGRIVKRSLDDFMENPPAGAVLPGYEASARDASAQAAAARAANAAEERAGFVSALRSNAEDAAGSNYAGLNFENELRKQYRGALRVNPVTQRSAAMNEGLNDAEIAAMRQLDRGTPFTNTLRWAAKTAGGGSGLGFLAAGGIGSTASSYYADDPRLGLSVPLTGLALRMASNRLAARNAMQIENMIRQRSPLFAERAAATGTRTPGYPGVANTGRNAITLELLRQQLAPTEDYANAP